MEHPAETNKVLSDDEPACCVDTPIVSIKPEWAKWVDALSIKRQSVARADLGLDTDRPIVMSGHQPIVFHNGIFVKLIALDEAAKKMNAQAIWIVPDQDAVDSGLIRVPTGSGELLAVEIVDLLPKGTVHTGVSAGSIAACEIVGQQYDSLRPIVEWLDQFASLESLAQQFGYATIEYACELLGIDPPRMIFASELFESDALYAIVETMREDPLRCASAYNDAVATHPDAGVRELAVEDGQIELPLWGCRFGEPREAVDTSNIELFSKDELLPRGLLMSSMARAHLADMFIHGTGGWIYDRIAEDWFADWLGITISPMAMVTATQHLDLGFSSGETVRADHAKWELHHARHTPAMVGDDKAQERKDQLVSKIESLSPKSDQRDVLYRELQALLIEYRSTHESDIKGFVKRAQRATELAEQYELSQDRTWAFVFFDQDALKALDHATRAMLG